MFNLFFYFISYSTNEMIKFILVTAENEGFIQ